MRVLMEEMMKEGWNRLETRWVLAIISDSEADINVRVEAEVVRKI